MEFIIQIGCGAVMVRIHLFDGYFFLRITGTSMASPALECMVDGRASQAC